MNAKKLLLVFMLFHYSVSAQNYLETMNGLIDKRAYIDASNFGSAKIVDLDNARLRNYYLEFMTYSCFALRTDQNVKTESCKILSDYLKINHAFFEANQNLFLFQEKKDSLCLHNAFISFDNIPLTYKARAQHTRSKEGAITDIHFKSYKALRHSSAIDFNNFFVHLSELDFDRLTSPSGHSVGHKEVGTNTSVSRLTGVEVAGVDTIAKYIKATYHTDSFYKSKNFVTVKPDSKKSDLKITADNLEKVLSFYNKQLGLPANNQLIIVYLSKNSDDVATDINKFYGVYSYSVLGFSDMDSRSIVAWIPAKDKVGTLKHELVHILIYNHYCFLPDWFEEGLASLYEESRFNQSGRLNGINNWRISYLNALAPAMRKTLFDGFIANNDSAFDIVKDTIHAQLRAVREKAVEQEHWLEHDIRESTVFLADDYFYLCKDAMSRYILLYIQSQGKLKNILDEIKRNEKITSPGYVYKPLEQIYLEQLHLKHISEAQRKFEQWLLVQK